MQCDNVTKKNLLHTYKKKNCKVYELYKKKFPCAYKEKKRHIVTLGFFSL